MSDYEKLKQFIEFSGYKVQTDIDNLITMCFIHYDSYIEEQGSYADAGLEYIDDCIEFIKENGLDNFDYYC